MAGGKMCLNNDEIYIDYFTIFSNMLERINKISSDINAPNRSFICIYELFFVKGPNKPEP